jgi:hypothetical protein
MLQGEPHLDELPAEPIVCLMMRADRVGAGGLRQVDDLARST